MFVVWQQLAVKGRGGGPFLHNELGANGAAYAPPWQGLRCEHHGTGRVEWTPFVVEDDRRDGQLHQKLLYRLPAIRSCCIADPFHRAAWWHDVDWAVKLWGKLGDPDQNAALARDRATIVLELRQVIPRPTPAGIQQFADFREDRAFEDQARDEANHAYWAAQVQQNQHQQARSDPKQRARDCFAVLKLAPGATLGQLKASYRDLVKEHHPDRGGDAAEFIRVQAAYEEATAVIERRTAT